jgi:hypothetical protein
MTYLVMSYHRGGGLLTYSLGLELFVVRTGHEKQ